jgi:hypothetical protein
MTIENLKLDVDGFDPGRPWQTSTLLEKLGLPLTATIETTPDSGGCFNDGIWTVSCAEYTDIILKRVPHQNGVNRPSDTKLYVELQKQIPGLVSEYALSFPLKIFRLSGPTGTRCKDLIVMRRAMGMQLTQHMFHKSIGMGQDPASWKLQELLEIFSKFGAFMHTIHRVYKERQHGDCQPSNVFYDEQTEQFTLIDVADFGYGPYLAAGGEDDVQHFVDGIKSLSQWYGSSLIADCEKHFRMGYK